jgi:hypothetical protein
MHGKVGEKQKKSTEGYMKDGNAKACFNIHVNNSSHFPKESVV